jgi:hypothetical protein
VILYRRPGLSGIELWRGISRGATLFQLRDDKPRYFSALREFLVQLHFGEARSEDELLGAKGFSRVVLCGGESGHPALERAMSADGLPFCVRVDEGGAYAAREGAFRVFRSMGWERGVALDLGQLHLKVMTADRSFRIARNPDVLPFGAHAIDAESGRAAIREMIGNALAAVPCPDGLVLGLPVAINADGVAAPATYPGLFGPVEPIFAELFDCPWVVMNDAVLAGVGFEPEEPGKTLIVTLGFGIGGALWEK